MIASLLGNTAWTSVAWILGSKEKLKTWCRRTSLTSHPQHDRAAVQLLAVPLLAVVSKGAEIRLFMYPSNSTYVVDGVGLTI